MEPERKILIVDDSDLSADVLAQTLEEKGYVTVRAANGIEGVITAYREIPDLIIMDVEMPVMRGYQAGRLLKSRREIRKIPIIMHTSLSEDRDKYWASFSGADAFVNKDFDNLENLLETVEKLAEYDHPDSDIILEDGKEIDSERVFEMVSSLYDQQLFQSTILNTLGSAGRSIRSLEGSCREVLELLPKICRADISIIMLSNRKIPEAYISTAPNVYSSDVDEFIRVCYPDFADDFPQLGFQDLKRVYLSLEGRTDFEKIRIDSKRVSSYFSFRLNGRGGEAIGSLHIGSFINHYFSEDLTADLEIFAGNASIIIENSLLYNQTRIMEQGIRNVFGKFVPREIIDDLVEKQSDEALLIGEKRRIVVLFSDIRSFTSISENNSAEAVVKFLNSHFTVMVDIIKKYGGSIDKFIGDAIFAIFGAPISYEDNAMRAVTAAAEMISAMKDVETGGINLPEIGYDIGIGLHEGVAIVGNIGSSEKFDYTAIGDTVNIASRLEGLTKHYKRKILISEELAGQLDETVSLREVDCVKVKGKMSATRLFSVNMPGDPAGEEARSNYEKGLKQYKLGNWASAEDYFLKVISSDDDWLSRMFLERCRSFSTEPPENWDGALALDFK